MVGGRRRGAGRRPGMSSDAPPGVAGRLHQTPRGAAAARAAGRADPSRPAGRLGQAGSPPAGPAPMRAAGSAAASSFSLSSPAASLPAPPARPPPGGLHSERPRTRGPTRPRPLSLRVSEEERRLRNRQPPPVPPPPPPPASPPRRGRARYRRCHDQWGRRPAGDAPAPRDWQSRQPIADVWLREAGTWRRRWLRRGGAGGRG